MLEDSRTRDDVQALFDAVPPPSLGSDTLARADDLLRRLPDGDGAALLGATIDGYTLTGVLGRGGQATVYLAEDRAGQRFAFKVPHQSVLDRLIREAQILFHLDHPSVVRVERANVKGEVPYVVTEYCARGTLADLLRERGRLTVPEVHDLAIAILHALAYAHHKGVVHRDLKPSNVLFAADGKVKVADFGIGRLSLVEGRQIAGTLVSAEQTLFAGTPLYMAPEQIHHAADVDPRADLYAVGKLLYEALTGLAPRTIKPVSRLVPGLRTDWDEFLFTLVDEDPDARFASAKDALTALPWPDEVARPAPEREQTSEALDVEAEADELVQRASRAARARLGLFEAGDRVDGHVVVGGPVADTHVNRYVIATEAAPTELRRLEVFKRPRSELRTTQFLLGAQQAEQLPPTPRLVRILRVGPPDRPYRIVEQPAGLQLEAWRQQRPVDPTAALRVVRQVAEGLQVLHASGLLHLHLTPDVIWVSPSGDAVLDGVGLGRNIDFERSTTGSVEPELSLYMPPVSDRLSPDDRADLYALGLIWYELVSGKPPLHGEPPAEILNGRAHERLTPIEHAAPDLPAAHARVLTRLLASGRDDRYRTQALLTDLAALEQLSDSAPTPKPGFWRRLGQLFRSKPSRPSPAELDRLRPLRADFGPRLRLTETDRAELTTLLSEGQRRARARAALLFEADGSLVCQVGETGLDELMALVILVVAVFNSKREMLQLADGAGPTNVALESSNFVARTTLVDRRVLVLLVFEPESASARGARDATRSLTHQLMDWFQAWRSTRLPPHAEADRVNAVLDELLGDV